MANKVKKLFRKLNDLQKSFFRFLSEWWTSRNPAVRKQSLALVVIGGGLLAYLIVAEGWARRSPDRLRVYALDAASAFDKKDYPTAHLYYKKLIHAGKKDPSTMFGFAKILLELKQQQRAIEIIKRIAPQDESGYGPAHFWLANYFIQEEEQTNKQLSQEKLHQLIYHLEQTLQYDPQHQSALSLLGNYYLQSDNPKAAIAYLHKAAIQERALKLDLAYAYEQIGEHQQAVIQAKQAAEHFQSILNEKPLDRKSLLGQIQAVIISRDYVLAEKLIKLAPLPVHDQALLENKVRLYKTAANDPQHFTMSARIGFLEAALSMAPEDISIHIMLAESVKYGNFKLKTKTLTKLKNFLEEFDVSQLDEQENMTHQLALGRVYLQMKDYDKAIAVLSQLNLEKPEIGLDLARAYQEKGDEKQAVKIVSQVIASFENKEISTITTKEKVQLAHALAFLKKWDHITQVLTMDRTEKYSSQDRMALRMTRSKLLMLQAKDISLNESPEKVKEKIELLVSALNYSSENKAAMRELASIAVEHKQLGQQALKAIQDQVAEGKASHAGHQLLGIIAAKKQDYELAHQHLEQALLANPENPDILNNLAWVLIRNKQPDYKRAMELVSKALEKDPKNPEMFETRGETYLRLGKYQLAVKDLEYVLAAFPTRQHIHKHLAEAYEKIGLASMAKKHRDLFSQNQK